VGTARTLEESTTVLGAKYRDEITGYEGVAVARCEYLSKCIHVELERGSGEKGKEGTPEGVWFDEERLVRLDVPAHVDRGEKRSPGRTPPSSSR
jgi:hypothetical protein